MIGSKRGEADVKFRRRRFPAELGGIQQAKEGGERIQFPGEIRRRTAVSPDQPWNLQWGIRATFREKKFLNLVPG
jgi:hypothetical protein